MILAIRLTGLDTLLVAETQRLPELISAIPIHVIVSAAAIVAIRVRRINVAPALEPQLVLSQMLQVPLVKSQLSHSVLTLKSLPPLLFKAIALYLLLSILSQSLLLNYLILPLALRTQLLLGSLLLSLRLLFSFNFLLLQKLSLLFCLDRLLRNWLLLNLLLQFSSSLLLLLLLLNLLLLNLNLLVSFNLLLRLLLLLCLLLLLSRSFVLLLLLLLLNLLLGLLLSLPLLFLFRLLLIRVGLLRANNQAISEAAREQ